MTVDKSLLVGFTARLGELNLAELKVLAKSIRDEKEKKLKRIQDSEHLKKLISSYDELIIQMVAMPADTNPRGDIFGGWLMSLMDLAAGRLAPKGKSATRAATDIEFFKPVKVGDLVSCRGYVLERGNTSATVHIDVYVGEDKVAQGDFVNVALNHEGGVRRIKDK